MEFMDTVGKTVMYSILPILLKILNILALSDIFKKENTLVSLKEKNVSLYLIIYEQN